MDGRIIATEVQYNDLGSLIDPEQYVGQKQVAFEVEPHVVVRTRSCTKCCITSGRINRCGIPWARFGSACNLITSLLRNKQLISGRISVS